MPIVGNDPGGNPKPMSVTNPSAPENQPAPISDVEKRIEGAVPDAVRPEVAAAIDEANATFDDAAAQAPRVHEQAAADEPGVAKAAEDAARIFNHGAVPLGELVTDFGTGVKEVKAGYKTTEFWLTAGAVVCSQVAALTIPGKYGPAIAEVAAAISTGFYALARGHAKN